MKLAKKIDKRGKKNTPLGVYSATFIPYYLNVRVTAWVRHNIFMLNFTFYCSYWHHMMLV